MNLVKRLKKQFFLWAGRFLILALFLCACSAANAQEITAINFNGEPLGKVIPDGKVVSFDNRLLGNVTADSLIIGTSGELIGGVVPQGVAIGNDARLLGKVGSDGLIRSSSGQVLGKALPNGLVVNEYFDVLGQIIFPGLVYNDEGKVSGRVTGDGLYTGLGGQQIGIVTPDGYAYRKIGSDYILDGRLISSKMVVSLSGEFIGSVVPGGEVTNFNSEFIGRLKANGFVYNDDGGIIGKIVSSGYAFDNNGFYIGFVSYNGEVINNNQIVGRLRADGMVEDINGNITGQSVDFAATATDLKGRYLGRLLPEGNLAKGTTSNGLAAARGQITDASGNVIGNLIATGPVFDYKGELKGHALSNGSVILLNGTTIGYIIGTTAYNLSGTVIGSVLGTRAVYAADGSFLGITGITPLVNNKGEGVSVSPQGYVFDQSGAIAGRSLPLRPFYTPFGTVSSYLGLDGKALNGSGAEFGRVVGSGFVLNSQNQITASKINQNLALNASGQKIGLIGGENILQNKSLSPVAKILPDGSVSEIRAGSLNYMPKVGEAYTAGAALDFNGVSLGYADMTGSINNSSGAKIGRVVARGLVEDNNGIIIGYLAPSGGVSDDKCNLLGVVSSGGGVYNYRGVYVGKLLENGQVISDSGSYLGTVAPDSPIIDFNGRVIGFSSYDGKAYNELNEFIGCLDFRHQLRNADNALIGKTIDYESVIGFDGKIVGYSIINGLVVDESNNLVGYQQPNDNVNTNAGLPLGTLFKYKIAFGLDNKFIGYISKDGQVWGNNGQEVGKIDFEGYVVADGQKIGYALNDFYVYNADGKVAGIISRNGDVSSFTNQNLGRFDRGFVLKGDKVIARGSRDYNIRDNTHLVLGQLQLDGRVLDNLNNVVGTLSADGSILNANSEAIAKASPLQFYSFLQQPTRKKIFDKDGNFIGYLDENGNLVDADGNIIKRADEKDQNLPAEDSRQAVYDENGNLIGYINPDGTIVDLDGNVIGKILPDGTIVDLEGNVVGKILPDGTIVDPDGNVISRISGMDVYDTQENKIGEVDVQGNVVSADGKVIARLNEKGEAVDANGNVIGSVRHKWFDRSDIVSLVDDKPALKEEDVSPALKLLEDSKYYKSLGIALTPDGEYLGDILENDTVVDKNGNIIGYRMPDGLIIDEEGNLIGTEDFGDDYAEDSEGSIFVPAGTFGPGGAYGVGNGPAGNLGPGGGYGPGERYDPTRRAALDAAMQQRRQNISVGKISSGYRREAFDGYQKDWSEQGIPKSISSWRVDMSEMIFSDKPIPAVIARAIDTNNPAPITAYVERNVYAEEGRNIIIPAGSRLIGTFGSITAAAEATSESARVQISWERLIRPDGSIFVFTGQTADAQGRAGALGYVDQQLFKKYTLPVVTTVLTSGASYFIASADDAAGEIETSKQQAANDARQNFLDDMESLFDDILADKTDVKAMTYIPAGTRIIVYPNTDLWLRTIERDSEESQKYQKPEILIDDVKTQQEAEEKDRAEIAKAASSGQVVYDPDQVDVEAVRGGTPPLIDDTAPKKTGNTLAPPPPPASGTLPAAGTPTAASGEASSSTTSSVPALF